MNGSYWQKTIARRLTRRRALAATGSMGLAAAFLAACGGDDSPASPTPGSGTGPTGAASPTGVTGPTGATGAPAGLITPAEDTSHQARLGGVLLRQIASDVPSLDVTVPIAPLSGISPFTFGRLLAYQPGILGPADGSIMGDVVDRWEFSGDQLELVLKLRPGVHFHPVEPVNGREVDIEDIIYSWERVATQGVTRAEVQSTNPNGAIIDITAVDSETAVMRLAKPLAYVLSLLSVPTTGHFHIFPKEAESEYDPRHVMIGTGPFYLSDYRPSIGFTFTKNPEYYVEGFPYIDQIEMPILSEYASNLAQLKSGGVDFYGNFGESVTADDALQVHEESPEVLLYLDDVSANPGQQTMFGYRAGSPFLDERVRQAYWMSIDRDAFIELKYNVAAMRARGIDMQMRWNTDLPNDVAQGWWLDPQSSEFGENARFFQHNIEEARALLAAAGYSGGGPNLISSHFTGPQYGIDFPENVEVLEGMSRDAGFTYTKNIVEYQQTFIPNYRDSRGDFDGLSYKLGPGAPSPDPAARLIFNYTVDGDGFYGFDLMGAADQSGDPFVEAELERARGELEDEDRRATCLGVQRHLAGKCYAMRWPGGSNRILMANQRVKNFNVFRGAGPVNVSPVPYLWLDT